MGPSQTLASYLPRYHLRLIAEGRRSGQDSFAESCQAAVLLVDVSGFTALTERFAKQGAAGAEQLSTILNRHCGRIAEITEFFGGDIIAFAGDSAIVMWPGAESQLANNVLRAVQAALRIQSELDGYEPHPGVFLRQRAGVACGTLEIMELGGVGGRWQFVVTGEPITAASVANQEAHPGQVMLSPAAWNLVEDYIEPADSGDGRAVVKAVRADSVPSLGGDPVQCHSEEASFPVLSPYVLTVVSDRLQGGQEAWIAEFRNLTMLFLSLPLNRNDGPIDVGSLHSALCSIQEVLERFEGTLYQFLMDDKGLTAVCAFGLPPLAHENDPRRAVEAAIALCEGLGGQNVPTSVGIATGPVFCGVYGSEHRRQYTTLGNTVNLAARLMQSADHSILCDETTSKAAGSASTLQFEPKGEILVKGRSAPVAVFSPTLRSNDARPTSSNAIHAADEIQLLVGREAERDFLTRALTALTSRGEGGGVLIEGEAGVGKSCLLEHFSQQVSVASRNGQRIPCWRTAADPIQQSTPYHAWRGIFGEALGLKDAPAADQRDHVLAQLEARPDLVPLAPLLNLILPLDLAETASTVALKDQARGENTQQLLVEILKETAARSPTVLILEDVHWFDTSSVRLALLVLQQIPGILLILSSRPLSEALSSELTAMLALPAIRRLVLGVLDTDLASQMVCRSLGVTRLPPEVERAIADRAGGHPLFSQQLAYALRDSGLIEVVDGRCRIAESVSGAALDSALTAMRFPSTVEGVITSRLDRMTQAQQLTVKIASVVGQSFSLPLLTELYPVDGSRSGLPGYLDELEKLELFRHVREDGPLYAFRHAVAQDAAYNSVPFAQRRQLHQSVAEWHERQFQANLAPHFPLLAHHWTRAESAPKAVYYCSEAGKQALRNHANPEAARFFSEALRLDEKAGSAEGPLPEAIARRRAEWELQLGKAYVNWSKYVEGRAHLESGLSLRQQRVPTNAAATAAGLVAEVVRQIGYRFLPGRLMGGRKIEREILLDSARTFGALTEIYFVQDNPLRCLHAVFCSLNLAESAGPSPELAWAYSSVASLLGFMSMHRVAEGYFARAEGVAHRIADPASTAWVALARAVYLTGIGKWDLAGTLLRQAIAENDTLGDRRRGDDARIILTLVQLFQGRFRESLSLANLLYDSAKQRLDVRIQAEALYGKAWNLLLLGRWQEFAASIEELDLLRSAQMKIGGWHRKQDVNSLYALLHMVNGDLTSAAKSAGDVLAATKESSQPNDILIHSAILEVYLHLLQAARNRQQADPVAGLSETSHETALLVAFKRLRSYSRVFPIGKPLLYLRRGQYEWIKGNRAKAIKCCEDSLQAALDLGAEYYQGLAHLELGTYLEANDPTRMQHLDQAAAILSRLGAARDLASLPMEMVKVN